MADRGPQNRPKPARDAKGRITGGGGSLNPGGRPRSVREVEAMLERDHRNPKKMARTFKLIRRVAHGVDEPVYYQGMVCGYKRKYDAGWMELYLNRVLGPVREPIDLSDAPPEVLDYLADKMGGLN